MRISDWSSDVCSSDLSGKGIPESEMRHLFEKFYRLPNSGTGGSGLGLSIAKGFVEAHGGAVSVANRAKGGALFRVTLPAEVSKLQVKIGRASCREGGCQYV